MNGTQGVLIIMLATGVAFALCPSVPLAAVEPETTVEPEATMEATAAPVEATPTTIPEAPFGLIWLASKGEIASIAGDLGKSFATEFGDSYIVSRLPKELADQYYSILSFGYDDRLIRITAIGRGFERDRSGSQVKARYAEIKELLEQKYGEGRSEEHTDPKFTGDRWEVGVSKKKNWMFTEFTAPGLRIELSVFDEQFKTNWRIIFEHVASIERLERRRKEAEEHAL